MTVEDEKGYEIAEKYLRKKYGDDYVDFIETEGQSYLDGYEQGYEDCRHYAHDYYKPKWHDLRKDSNDLPKHSGEYWCKWKDGTYSTVHYFGDNGFGNYVIADSGFGSYVIAWCELPLFEE